MVQVIVWNRQSQSQAAALSECVRGTVGPTAEGSQVGQT